MNMEKVGLVRFSHVDWHIGLNALLLPAQSYPNPCAAIQQCWCGLCCIPWGEGDWLLEASLECGEFVSLPQVSPSILEHLGPAAAPSPAQGHLSRWRGSGLGRGLRHHSQGPSPLPPAHITGSAQSSIGAKMVTAGCQRTPREKGSFPPIHRRAHSH